MSKATRNNEGKLNMNYYKGISRITRCVLAVVEGQEDIEFVKATYPFLDWEVTDKFTFDTFDDSTPIGWLSGRLCPILLIGLS